MDNETWCSPSSIITNHSSFSAIIRSIPKPCSIIVMVFPFFLVGKPDSNRAVKRPDQLIVIFTRLKITVSGLQMCMHMLVSWTLGSMYMYQDT